MFAHTNNDSMMFDYRFTQHSGRHSHWVYQTVVCFSNVTPLPSFVMRPENVFHKIGSAFGYRDIDFASHAGFSGSYILRGEDEEAIRDLFKAYVLDFFARSTGVSVECNGTHMIVYEARKRRKPEDIAGYYGQCKEMHGVFNS